MLHPALSRLDAMPCSRVDPLQDLTVKLLPFGRADVVTLLPPFAIGSIEIQQVGIGPCPSNILQVS
jgi:hypothetical protein